MITKAGFEISEATHQRYLAQARKRRRRIVREALRAGLTVPYPPEQLAADGWGPRQIAKVSKR